METTTTTTQTNNDHFQEEFKFIQDHLPSWKDVDLKQVSIQVFPFGHSRVVSKVSSNRSDINPNQIILRKDTIDPNEPLKIFDKELICFKYLGEVGIGPTLYAHNGYLRIEEYLPSRVMRCDEINQTNFRRKLALNLGAIHRLSAPPLLLTNNDNNDNSNDNSNNNRKNKISKDTGGFVRKLIDSKEFMDACRSNCTSEEILRDKYTEEERQTAQNVLPCFSVEEVEFVRQSFASFPLVWSHNDIWTGNMLVVEPSQDPRFIDYELMDYNFPGYDIGKLLAEPLFERVSASNADWTLKDMSYFPSDQDINDFLRYYLIAYKKGFNPRETLDSDQLEQLGRSWNGLFSPNEQEDQRIAEETLKHYWHQVRVGLMVAAYYCLLLSLRYAKLFPAVHFDFMKFGRDNYILYVEFKKRYLEYLASSSNLNPPSQQQQQ